MSRRPKLSPEERKKRDVEKSTKYIQQHIDQVKEYRKKYYQEHKEESSARFKKYYEKNSDVLKEKSKNYHHQNREENIQKMRERRRKDPEKQKQIYRKEYEKDKSRIVYYNRKRRLGVTKEQYLQMLKDQNQRCAICEITVEENGKQLCVDHDHSNGRIRMLLCNRCNLVLGNAQDNIHTLEAAIEYLKKFSDERQNDYSI